MIKKDDDKQITRRDVALFSGLGSLCAGLLGRIWGGKNYESRKPLAKTAAGTLFASGGVLLGMEIGEALHDPTAADNLFNPMSRRGLLGVGLNSLGVALSLGYKTNKLF